ncbi:hypothetical protein [Mesorhizobium sp.]|uniref:hypothetical protein n=1 Tax=Mesorhizobium sp. TaxID=1871066 RepID=UPI000FE8AF57|nr:hypothetical protein [Mesorhizobium sp.]RWI12403.1 MAG: hypothetical protein EOQ90_01695 [Mesorhizobium sp.]RWM86298.1 MAG: hypothetical protein EOR83_08270 [Mesorhizobium sp.]TIP79262.1 MAG: hypothetical protein E5X63_35105 [Mesorhizobium sp.]TIP83976.1 MAG: hypothetical protein E5X58_36825 [Mesorhizobium sp.]TJW55074.1 MAG: hypothetical protein E5X65_07835 [Mesorhizobium sp.]
MATWLWVALILAGAVLLWWIAKLAATYFISAEFSGLALLRKELRDNGVDVKRIPETALQEIVANKISGAKGLANCCEFRAQHAQ